MYRFRANCLYGSKSDLQPLVLILGLAFASCNKGGPISPEEPMFRLSSTTVAFSGSDQSRELTITNLGSERLDWRVLSSTASWLTAEPAAGSLNPHDDQPLTVRIDRRAVANGNHTGSLHIGAGDQSLALSVAVQESQSAQASLEPKTLNWGPEDGSATVQVSNTGEAALEWTLRGPSWTTVSPGSGSLPPGGRTSVVITPHRAGLTPGQHTADLQLASNGGAATTTLLVAVAGLSGLRLEPQQLDFGTSTTRLSMRVVNDSEQALDWTAVPGGSWIDLSGTSGRVPPHLSQLLTVEVTRSGLPKGSNQAPILFSTNRGTSTAMVLATVQSAQGPTPEPVLPPQIGLSPISLNFGEQATELIIHVNNQGDVPLEWDAEAAAGWISLPIAAGRVSPHSSLPVTVRVLRSGLTPGSYSSLLVFQTIRSKSS